MNIPALSGAEYYAEQIQDKAEISAKFTKNDLSVRVNTWVSATANTSCCRTQNRTRPAPLHFSAQSGGGKYLGECEKALREMLIGLPII